MAKSPVCVVPDIGSPVLYAKGLVVAIFLITQEIQRLTNGLVAYVADNPDRGDDAVQKPGSRGAADPKDDLGERGDAVDQQHGLQKFGVEPVQLHPRRGPSP